MSTHSNIPTVKILLLGESAVGKTSLLFQFTDNKFIPYNISTSGVDFKSKIINVDNTQIKLQLWDTSGQEKFRAITKQYYRGAQGILLVYDITSVNTFDSTKYWLNSIKESADENVDIILIGNKCDLDRRVKKEDAESYAKSLNIPYFETSAKDNTNVNEVFEYIGSTVYRRISKENVTQKNSVDIAPDHNEVKDQQKKSCNC